MTTSTVGSKPSGIDCRDPIQERGGRNLFRFVGNAAAGALDLWGLAPGDKYPTAAGTTSSAATNVTVNTSNATRYADNTFASTNHTLINGTNIFTAIGQDSYGRSDTSISTAYLPASIAYSHDANGNLTYDGQKAFEYDDENQLIRITRTNNWKSEFTYDGKMRRRVRKEYVWSSGSSSWVLSNEVRYVYDGNLVIQERNSWNLPQVTYTRGNDLSGSMEGAGGIGGLLARTDHSTLTPTHACYFADGSGNISSLVDSHQATVARYSYGPFGDLVSLSGRLAEANVYRFSSKERHENSGLIYFLSRYYCLELHRWLNRDPLGEEGGVNLYRFVDNSALDMIDPWGNSKAHVNRGGPGGGPQTRRNMDREQAREQAQPSPGPIRQPPKRPKPSKCIQINLNPWKNPVVRNRIGAIEEEHERKRRPQTHPVIPAPPPTCLPPEDPPPVTLCPVNSVPDLAIEGESADPIPPPKLLPR